MRAYYTERLEAATTVQEARRATSQCCVPGAPQPATDPAATPPPSAADAAEVDIPSFGCGQPTLLAELRAGETVLDLGSGAGLDAFRAAEAVGPEGRVIGVDMTPAMLTRARAGAARLGLDFVRFLEGTIEALPVADATVDVVISNCVVNLSQDKAAVFGEAFRVLRPGGRLAISDVLRNGARTSPGSVEGWCACVDGAEAPERYRSLLRRSGFADITIDAPPATVPVGGTYSAAVRARKPAVRVADASDLPAVSTLLRLCGLPTDGIDAGQTRLYIVDASPLPAAAGGAERLPLAVVGIELYGEDALLRSLAVHPEARGHGYGEALLRHALREAAARGARTAYGLTTTIPELLLRWGFTETPRASLPATLDGSTELQGACPADAPAFVLPLD